MGNNGFVKIHRKLLDNPIATKPNYFSVWVYLILMANHEDRDVIWNNERTTIKRGQMITSLRGIAKRFKISSGSLHKIFKYLICEQMIEHQANHRFSLVTIRNYEAYQRGERKSENNVNTKCAQSETNKKDKNEKNEKKERETNINFLLEISEEEMKELTKTYKANYLQVKEKGEELYDYCISKGRTYKNYKAFLTGALRRDFGKRYE